MNISAVVSFLGQFLDDISTVTDKKEYIEIVGKKDFIQLNVYIKSVDSVEIKSINGSFGEKHIVNVCQMNRNQDIVEFAGILSEAMRNPEAYCISCGKKIDFMTTEYTICGDTKCEYNREEMIMGDKVVQVIKEIPDIVTFLLITSFTASKSPRRDIIFEPFPVNLVSGHQVRGEVTALQGSMNKKDFKKIDSLMSGNDSILIKKIIETGAECNTDEQLAQKIGKEMYIFVRFIIMSNKTRMQKVNLFEDRDLQKIVQFKISHSQEKEEEFNKIEGKKLFLFHGSSGDNWHSILRNGIKVSSNTKLMTSGAAYGKGIYLSDNFNISLGYIKSLPKVMAVFEVIHREDHMKKTHFTGGVYVVPNEELLILRYLLYFPLNLQRISSYNVYGNNQIIEFNRVFKVNLVEQKEKIDKTSKSVRSKRIMRELQEMNGLDLYEKGMDVIVDDSNMFVWYIHLFNFDPDTKLSKDLERLHIPFVKLEVTFPSDYPIKPPFVRVVNPRFKLRTGHVTSGGSICMDILTPQSWSAVCRIESLVYQIKGLITYGDGTPEDAPGEIDPRYIKDSYTMAEAKASFTRVANAHGWI